MKKIGKRYVWRDSDTGRILDVRIARPAVQAKERTITAIKRALESDTRHKREKREAKRK